jgi:hypothetical protein
MSARPQGCPEVDPSRLRRGEVIVGVSSALLLAFMFALPWYGRGGAATSLNAWHSLSGLRWLILLTVVAGLGLVFLQLTRRAPALPVTMSVIVMLLGGIIALALIYRVLINLPGPDGVLDAKIGAFLGLIAAWAIAVGGFLSTRQEGLTARDARTEIPTVRLGEEE